MNTMVYVRREVLLTSLVNVIDIRTKLTLSTYTAFIDISKAYDSINHSNCGIDYMIKAFLAK